MYIKQRFSNIWCCYIIDPSPLEKPEELLKEEKVKYEKND
jgi:hypothetical protein